MISIASPVLSDNPPGLVIDKRRAEYTAYIYGDAYEEYLHPYTKDVDMYIGYTPVKYRYGYEDHVRYYPVSFFVYNRWTFYDEATMFTNLINYGYYLLGKRLNHYNIYDNVREPVLGPIIIVDTFHAYANSIWRAPTTDRRDKVFQRYDVPDNYYNKWYKPFTSEILYEISGLHYDYKHDPLGAITNISGIAVFYLPTSPYIVAPIGWDKRSNKPIISSALILSIVNSREQDRLAQIVYLNPMMFVHLENKYHGKIPDVIVLVSPAAGLNDEDIEEIKQYYPGLKGEWIPITKLLHDLGARVVGIKVLPDTYKFYRYKTGKNVYKYLDTAPFFPYLANDWLQIFFQYLSKGYTVKESAQLARDSVISSGKANKWHQFMLVLNWTSSQTNTIINLISTVAELIYNSENISEMMLQYENGIEDLANILFLPSAALKEELEEVINEYFVELFDEESEMIEDYAINITNTFYRNIILAFKEFINTFIIDPSKLQLYNQLIIESSQWNYIGITIVGNGNYHLNDPDPPDPPDGGGHHSPIDNPGFNYMA